MNGSKRLSLVYDLYVYSYKLYAINEPRRGVSYLPKDRGGFIKGLGYNHEAGGPCTDDLSGTREQNGFGWGT